jgi:hypothetical protein
MSPVIWESDLMDTWQGTLVSCIMSDGMLSR